MSSMTAQGGGEVTQLQHAPTNLSRCQRSELGISASTAEASPVEDADTTRSYQETHHYQHNAHKQLPTHQRNHTGDHQHDRNNPKNGNHFLLPLIRNPVCINAMTKIAPTV
jgi:hypothetical protein